MNLRTIKLNISQLAKSFHKSRFNKYSDSRKEKYQEQLNLLFQQIEAEDLTSLSQKELVSKKLAIDFIYESLEFLDNSTLTSIPFEIIYCIETVLNEWMISNNYIVVTSLNNNISSYSIKGYLAFNEPIYLYIKNEYNIEFENRLIQINLPKYLMHDYLANVVLFHELGHFIDNYYKISQSIINNKIDEGILLPWNNPNTTMVYRHYREYFADIFASQYIGNASNIFLNHIAFGHQDSQSHPATQSRIDMVNKFLGGNADVIKDEILLWTQANSSFELTIRYIQLDEGRFDELIPYEVNDTTELVSIFIAGWKNWISEPNNLSEKFGDNVAYKIINNLIEKSISNYIVTSKWKLSHVSQ